jgi:hypothetical protein
MLLTGKLDSGTDIMLFAVTNRNVRAGTFTVCLQIDHHDGVPGGVKQSRSLQHREA